MRARRLTFLVLLPVAFWGGVAPAAADTATGGGYIEEGTPTAEVGVPGSGDGGGAQGVGSGGSGGSGGGSGGSGRCEYERIPDSETLLEPDGSERVAPGEGSWYIERCYNAAGQEISYNVVFIAEGGAAPAPVVDPETIARRLMRQLPLTAPTVATSPPPQRDQLVNLATWLWVDDGWEPLSVTASLPGVSVTVTATPTSVVWEMGTGDVVVCDGPGTPFDAGRREEEQSTDCSYTYRQSSANQPDQRHLVTATRTWSVSWSASGIAGGGDLGEVSRSTGFSLRVAEGQALVTDGR